MLRAGAAGMPLLFAARISNKEGDMCVASCCSPLRYSPCSRANVGSLRLRYGSSVLLLVLAVLGGSTLVAAQEAVEMVSATDSIPRANFRTWSLFLVCNPEWLTPEKSQDLFHLYREFSSFGRTIGDDNLAVWFWKSKERSDNPNLAENVDVERSVRYCKALGLKPSEGPHLFVTSTYPDSTKPPKDFADFSLAKMSPGDVATLLLKVTDELVAHGRIGNQAEIAGAPESIWVKLLEATQRTIGKFGCAWSLKVQTGFLTADLHPPCPASPTG